MNPFTAAVAGGALTVGNKNPRPTRSSLTGQTAQSESRGENEKLENKQHRSKMQDQNEAGQQPHDKQERECIIL